MDLDIRGVDAWRNTPGNELRWQTNRNGWNDRKYDSKTKLEKKQKLQIETYLHDNFIEDISRREIEVDHVICIHGCDTTIR